MKRKLKAPIKFGLLIWAIITLVFGGMAVSCSKTWAELGVSILIGLTAMIPMSILRIED